MVKIVLIGFLQQMKKHQSNRSIDHSPAVPNQDPDHVHFAGSAAAAPAATNVLVQLLVERRECFLLSRLTRPR